MGAREGLSVVVITRNEERNLARCLGSLAWAEQLVVVDSESTDTTREVARRLRAEVFVRPWPGFVAQWNFGIDQARGPWILVLSADEWFTEAGAEEIRRELASGRADAYESDRVSSFDGAFLRAWSPDWRVHLFRKEKGRFAGGLVHESVALTPGCRVVRLREKLYHLSYRSAREYVERMNRYTDLAAAGLVRDGRPFSYLDAALRPPAAFLKYYLLRRGFLDGFRGFFVSAGSAYYVFLKYAKLWEARRAADPRFVALAGSTPEDPRPGDPVQSG